MKEDIVYKLKALQQIEADKEWKKSNKERVMENIPAFGLENDLFLSSKDFFVAKSKFNLKSVFASHLAVSLTSLMVVLTSGVVTVGASQSSLPGETLYSVKIASEQVALAVASEENKPRVEIEQAGKRLEELAIITQKPSDVNQHEKIEQLVNEFEDKVNNANELLNDLQDKGKGDAGIKEKVVGTAEVVNEQSEKYSEVLEKTTESMPESVKEKVAVSMENAVKTTEKTNMEALLVIVESKTEEGNAETEKDRVQKKLDKTEGKLTLIKEEILSNEICSNNEEESEAVNEEEGSEAEEEVVYQEKDENEEEISEDGENDEIQDELELSLQENENISCIDSNDFEFRTKLVLEVQDDISEAKKKIEEKNLMEALNILALASDEISKFENGEFVQEVQEEVEATEENESGDEEGSVEGASTEAENTEEDSNIEENDNDENIENNDEGIVGDGNSENSQEKAEESEEDKEGEDITDKQWTEF